MTNPATILPDATKGIQNIYKAIGQSGTDGKVLELVHLRASQINGCSPCVFGGIKSALKNGETDERLHQVAAWRDSDLFTDAERAALAMAEAATRLADNPTSVSDEIWAAASAHFGEKELSAIVLMIALTNMFNRINTTVRAQAGATW
ncbi:carboxymuconolactone decarboxylase family protein [Kribbella sp. NBC_00709]|uniref:carboxymuconolactone decarboxylase family protein n=1 Tax=Kribbella sp. NBC_00709 TaxID=2975972 RepID=UPI002E2C7A33|nr:carboxymuconolactone decarboxylase family protein [Kribbella sp. NBC_00709]